MYVYVCLYVYLFVCMCMVFSHQSLVDSETMSIRVLGCCYPVTCRVEEGDLGEILNLTERAHSQFLNPRSTSLTASYPACPSLPYPVSHAFELVACTAYVPVRVWRCQFRCQDAIAPVSPALVRPSLAGTDRCCDYPRPPDHPHDIGAVIAFIVFSTVMAICCVATCLVLPMCIGGIVYAVYRSKRKKRLQQQQRWVDQRSAPVWWWWWWWWCG